MTVSSNDHDSTMVMHEILAESQEPLNITTKMQMENEEPIDIYLPEPKSTRSMLKLPKDVKNEKLNTQI